MNRARREAAALLVHEQQAIVERLVAARASGNRALSAALETQLNDVCLMIGTNRCFPLAR